MTAFNTESTIKQYTVIFFGRATGSFLGSWVSGWLIDNYHHTFFLPFVILGHAAFYICIPLTGQLVIVALCISLRYDQGSTDQNQLVLGPSCPCVNIFLVVLRVQQ